MHPIIAYLHSDICRPTSADHTLNKTNSEDMLTIGKHSTEIFPITDFVAHPSLASEYYNRSDNAQTLRMEVSKILDGSGSPTCNTQWTSSQIFYNRIGKAGSESLSEFFKTARRPETRNVKSLVPSDRGSDEFLSQSGELELMQKILGNEEVCWMPSQGRSILTYHTFFVNFSRWGAEMPVYINLMREPAARSIQPTQP